MSKQRNEAGASARARWSCRPGWSRFRGCASRRPGRISRISRSPDARANGAPGIGQEEVRGRLWASGGRTFAHGGSQRRSSIFPESSDRGQQVVRWWGWPGFSRHVLRSGCPHNISGETRHPRSRTRPTPATQDQKCPRRTDAISSTSGSFRVRSLRGHLTTYMPKACARARDRTRRRRRARGGAAAALREPSARESGARVSVGRVKNVSKTSTIQW